MSSDLPAGVRATRPAAWWATNSANVTSAAVKARGARLSTSCRTPRSRPSTASGRARTATSRRTRQASTSAGVRRFVAPTSAMTTRRCVCWTSSATGALSRVRMSPFAARRLRSPARRSPPRAGAHRPRRPPGCTTSRRCPRPPTWAMRRERGESRAFRRPLAGVGSGRVRWCGWRRLTPDLSAEQRLDVAAAVAPMAARAPVARESPGVAPAAQGVEPDPQLVGGLAQAQPRLAVGLPDPHVPPRWSACPESCPILPVRLRSVDRIAAWGAGGGLRRSGARRRAASHPRAGRARPDRR